MGPRKDESPIYLSLSHILPVYLFRFYLWYFFFSYHKRLKMIPSLSHKLQYSIFESIMMKVFFFYSFHEILKFSRRNLVDQLKIR